MDLQQFFILYLKYYLCLLAKVALFTDRITTILWETCVATKLSIFLERSVIRNIESFIVFC